MSTPISARTHMKRVSSSNDSMSASARNGSVKARNAARRKERAETLAARPVRTPQEQLARLDAAGHVAKKERERLQKAIDKAA